MAFDATTLVSGESNLTTLNTTFSDFIQLIWDVIDREDVIANEFSKAFFKNSSDNNRLPVKQLQPNIQQIPAIAVFPTTANPGQVSQHKLLTNFQVQIRTWVEHRNWTKAVQLAASIIQALNITKAIRCNDPVYNTSFRAQKLLDTEGRPTGPDVLVTDITITVNLFLT